MFKQNKHRFQNTSRVVIGYVARLRDVRVVGQLVFVIIVLLVSWSGVKTIDTNYGLEKQITILQQQNELQQLENTNLQLRNGYYNSNQYLELSARQDFGLAAPGEKEIVVPDSVAMTYVVPHPKPPATTPASIKLPVYQQNLEAWLNFFLHRPPACLLTGWGMLQSITGS